jgi:hypothetical protein
MASQHDDLPDDDKLTLDIRGAAEYATGGVVSTFKRKFVESGLVQLIDLGGRSPRILKSQIRDAVLKIAADQAAHPELKVARSGGAVLAARGRIANPWGRKGRPPEAKPQPKAKTGKRA